MIILNLQAQMISTGFILDSNKNYTYTLTEEEIGFAPVKAE
jgi:hypothetical protein